MNDTTSFRYAGVKTEIYSVITPSIELHSRLWYWNESKSGQYVTVSSFEVEVGRREIAIEQVTRDEPNLVISEKLNRFRFQ